MHTFVNSLESACRDSRIVAKYHRHFQVFYSVAFRYTELRGASPPSREESMRLRMEMDTQLNALGLQVQAGSGSGSGNVQEVGVSGQTMDVADENAMLAWPSAAATGIDPLDQFPASGISVWEEQSLRLGNWFSFSQNMMELADQNEWPV